MSPIAQPLVVKILCSDRSLQELCNIPTRTGGIQHIPANAELGLDDFTQFEEATLVAGLPVRWTRNWARCPERAAIIGFRVSSSHPGRSNHSSGMSVPDYTTISADLSCLVIPPKTVAFVAYFTGSGTSQNSLHR
jgi:hypothetical protein